MAAGSGLAAVVVTAAGVAGFHWLVVGNAACSALNVLALHRLARSQPVTAAPARRRGLSAVRDRRYMLVAACNGVLSLHVTALFVGLPAWAAIRTDAPRGVIALLVGANSVLVVVLQIPLSRRVNTLTRAARFGATSSALFAGAAVITAATAGVSGAVAATAVLALALVLLTLAEIWQTSSAWVISEELAPPDRQSEYLAAFSTGMALQRFAGPALYGGLVIPLGYYGWASLALVVVVVGLAYPRLIRSASLRAGCSTQPADAGHRSFDGAA
jgi:hypothetical protein